MTLASEIVKRAPFDRPDLFLRSEAHGSGRLYFLQPALSSAQRDEAVDVARSANPFAPIAWFNDMSLIVWGLD